MSDVETELKTGCRVGKRQGGWHSLPAGPEGEVGAVPQGQLPETYLLGNNKSSISLFTSFRDTEVGQVTL